MTTAVPIAAPAGAADESWRAEALCTQVDVGDLFFPDKGNSTDAHAAKAICARCPVKAACLEYALEHDERFGIWGGLSVKQRRALHHQRQGSRRRSQAACGTEARAKRHWRAGEKPCDSCRRAVLRRRDERRERRSQHTDEHKAS
jgi:WhiB family redox-sensing transcriptional regulator